MMPRSERRNAVLGLLAVAVTFWLPAFFRPFHTGYGDWQMIHHNWEVGYVALRRFGEWPLWNPFHCGGITMWGNPESQHLSPFFFLSFVMGTTLAIKAMVVVHTWAGLVGMYTLGRRHFGLEPTGAAYAAILWGCSGFFAWQISGGHGTFISFYLAPWVLLAWRAACEDWRWSAALAALMTLTAFEGGTYPFPYFVLLLGFDAGVQLVRGVRWTRVALAAATGGALTVLMAAARWIPALRTLERVPRSVADLDALMPWEIPEMFLRWRFPWFRPGHPFVWPEYSVYVGVAGTALIVAGIYFGVRRRRYALLAGAAVFGTFMMGHFADWAPWSLVHHLPIYRSLRVPSRFSVLFLLYLAPLAGLALQELLAAILRSRPATQLRRARPKVASLVPAVAVALLLLEPMVYGIGINNRWYRAPISDTSKEEPTRFHLIPAINYPEVYASLPRRHQGTPSCYVGNLDWRISGALWLGDHPQARLGKGRGTVQEWGRTVNRAWADVSLHSEARVVFNHNHDPGWHALVGEMAEDRGRLAVDMPAGDHRVEVVYRPAYLGASLALTTLGIVASLLMAGWLFVRRRATVRAPRAEYSVESAR
jgi:hypothetical protein